MGDGRPRGGATLKACITASKKVRRCLPHEYSLPIIQGAGPLETPQLSIPEGTCPILYGSSGNVAVLECSGSQCDVYRPRVSVESLRVRTISLRMLSASTEAEGGGASAKVRESR